MYRELEAHFESEHPGLLERFPLVNYIQALDVSDRLRGYRHVPPVVQSWRREITDQEDRSVLGKYHKMALSYLISRYEDRLSSLKIPPATTELIAVNFERILTQLVSTDSNFYLHENDLFAKDFALCRLKLLPCGAEVVDRYSGVPRRILLRLNLMQSMQCLRFITSSGGFKPWYESHWDRRLINSFTPKGYDLCYLHVAELLKLNPHIKGMFSSSWWFDPALEMISSNLTFLRKVPQENGARLLKIGTNANSTRDAIRYSPTRKKHFDERKYRPTVYMLTWGRCQMLEWSERYST